MNLQEIRQFVARYTEPIHRLETALSQTNWDLSTSGSDAAKERLVELEVQLKQLFADPADFLRVRGWQRRRHEIDDALLQRQVEHLYLAFLANREDEAVARDLAELRAEVESRYMNFRAAVQGARVSDNEIREVLRTDRDSVRLRETWEASKHIGREVRGQVILLAELRNRSARDQGFEDFYARALATQEIDLQRLFGLLDDLERGTREPFRAVKQELDDRLSRRFGISADQLRPWHYGDPFFQEPPPLDDLDLDALYEGTDPTKLAVATFTGMGLEVSDILERSDLYEREHKDQHAFCTHIDRMSDDVRILCNLRPNEYWTATILHELGHAVYDKYLDPDLPYLLHDIAHLSTTEAIAMLTGRLTHDAEWLRTVLGVPASRVAQLMPRVGADQRLAMLIFVRWALVVVHFEREIYRDPRRPDLNQLWWDLVERFQLVRRPAGRDEPDWAAKIHLALYPVYYQNYILGELTASQLHHHLVQQVGGIVSVPQVGPWLRDRIFKPGARYDWSETVSQATGEALSPAYFVKQFVRG